MKKFLKVVLIIALVVVIGTIGYFGTLNFMKKKIESSIDTAFSSLKSGDEEKLKEYIDIDETFNDMENESNISDMEHIMLKNLNYEIESIDVELGKSTVKLKISNKNFKEIFQNYMLKAMTLAIAQSFNEMSDEELENQLKQYLEEQCDSEKIETVSSEVTVIIKRQKGKWSTDFDKNEMIEAILPGYSDFVKFVDSFDESDS